MRNSNKNQAVANILENLSEPDTKWAVPVAGMGIIFGLTPNCDHNTTTEFIAVDGKVVFRSDRPMSLVKMHGRLWGLAEESVFKPGANKLLMGAVVYPRGGQGASILRLRVSKGIRMPVGYLKPEEVDHSIQKDFGIKKLLPFPVQAHATPTPASSSRPSFIITEVPEPVAAMPIPAGPKPVFTRAAYVPGYFEKVRKSRSRQRNCGPAAPRKPINDNPPITEGLVGNLLHSMTRLPRHWEENDAPSSSLPGVFGLTVG